MPCTCGELVQGILEGEPFLVSCPIDRYSRVRVTVGSSEQEETPSRPNPKNGAADFQDDRVRRIARTGSPAGGDSFPGKALRAAQATLALLGYAGIPFSLELYRSLPPSKGFGTSTADVVGAIVASAAAVGAALDPAEVARLAVAVEPSDATMFPGLAFFNHRTGRQWEILGQSPSMPVAVLDFEGGVDTLDYNAGLDLELLRSLEPDHTQALKLLWQGLKLGRLELVGRAATASARINQQLLAKPELERVIDLGERFGALGVCVAHSGTAMGVLFAPGESLSARRLLAVVRGSLRGLREGWLSRMVGGGAKSVFSHEDGEKRATESMGVLRTSLSVSDSVLPRVRPR